MRSLLISAIIIIVLFSIGYAQTTEKQSTQSLLPEINPQDIEIRGVFKASFPGIRRQPILGFNPKPRVYRVDPNRLPFMEDDRAAAVQLPIQAFKPSSNQPDLPVEKHTINNGFVGIGGGNFMSGLAEIGYRLQASNKTQLNLSGRYFLTDGHTTNPIQSDFEQQKINLNVGHQISKNRHIQLNTFYEGGYLYQPVITTSTVQARKQLSRYGLSMIHEAVFNPVSHSTIDAYIHQFTMNLNRRPGSFDAREMTYGAKLRLAKAGFKPENNWGIILQTKGAIYNQPTVANISSTNWFLVRSTIARRKRLNDQSTIKLNLGGIYAQAVNTYAAGIYPEFSAQLIRNLSDAFSFGIKAYLTNTIQNLSDYQTLNPFIDLGISSPLTTEYGMSAQMTIQPVSATKFSMSFNYSGFREYAYFSLNTPTRVVTDPKYFGLSVAQYARMPELSVHYKQYAIGQKLEFNAHYTLRQVELTGERLPSYVPQMEGFAEARFRLNSRVDVWLNSQYTGSRYTQTVGLNDEADKNQHTLDSYLLLHSGASYQFLEKFKVSVRFLNMLSTDYEHWLGYRERTAEFRLELKYIF